MGTKVKEVIVHVDGACAGQGTPTARAGWGVSVKGDLSYRSKGRVEGKQDSNRAETWALLEAMRWLDQMKGVILNIRTDSAFLVDGIKNKNARSSNSDLWEELGPLLEANGYRIRTAKWIERDENNDADSLAKEAANCFILLDDSGNVMEFDLDAVTREA